MPAVRIMPEIPAENRTLGWQILEWMVDNLVHGVTGEPLELTNEGIDFVLCAYAIDDEGRWLYDRAALRRARGTGKSPLAAAMACAELCGPVRFGGWDEDGFPIGVPEPAPWVQIIAITMEQTKPIMDIARASFSEAAIEKYGLTIGIEAIIKAHRIDGGGPGRLAAIANNPRALRGPRPTAVFADEVSEWIASNGGHASMIRIMSNLAKNPGGRARLFEFCNAFEPGLDSHAERTYQAYVTQVELSGFSRILYDTLEADPALKLTNMDELEEAIRQAAGDAYWLDVRRLVNQALDTGTSPTTFRREHLNQILSDDDSLISMPLFDELGQNVRPLDMEDVVTLGFDGSLSGDGTAIVAYRLEDHSFHLLEYWEPPTIQDPNSPKWRIDEQMVDDHFRAYMETLNVVAAACDVHPFESWVYAWEKDYGQKLQAKASAAGQLIRDNRSDQRGLTYLCEALVNEIESKKIHFRPTLTMRMHWANAKRRLNRWGFSFGKITKSSTKRVDIVAASLMAYSAANALAKDFNPKPKPRPARVHQIKDGGLNSW
jgi:hypothetical protein